MQKEQVLLKIKQAGIVAVVRGNTKQEALDIVKECVAGGITAIELTFTTPFAHHVIEELHNQYGNSILLGAGTVLDSETARIAILSGAQFIVSPHFNADVIRMCNRYRIANMSGIMTITEAVSAMEAGCDILKVFPGEVLGINFLKAIKGPLPYAQLMPTGGVNPENVCEWLQAGAVAVGAGSSLTKGNVKQNAEQFIKQIHLFREG
ncbi:bifunctional 2-keto-4-hydroxyglutarate aldolase/2-keto-3-deoxy-6-phosphogluconate aldolase [Paludicola sp. MB14-C6]|uniref:bifunctional 2-keto-4-hydroxyglutarate aldolase/2-keto-3-deoxy-6-phosphogluconate aldolase n=1 Tax=Paludihabitans sp. MB14-C6 TaxID=3070656 RepID=UPI0027DCA8CA|nr:bifunctional 2-keto-4-hydroxyglutarate aldolase/2-keto-3-deoxy-6-phosphogluconate aldolase [Paludicola sp. MB14-C6]WMJ23258.1 bifunctional 2-keto-4-hydroxyglutarate aldolase/2-keto-3-deoxy-6-phosphogluconate aldolase [Paludicola sp. MB14-C6]